MIPSATKISITVQSVGDQANCSVKWTVTILICDLSPDKKTVKITLSAIQHLIPLNVTQSNFFKLASKSHLFSNPNLFLSLNNCPNFVTLKPKRILNNFYFLNLSTSALFPRRTCCSDQALSVYTNPYRDGKTGNVKIVFCTRSLHVLPSWELIQPITKLCMVHNN